MSNLKDAQDRIKVEKTKQSVEKREWPADNKPARFQELTWPITRAIRHAYALKRLPLKDILWIGLPNGERERCSCHEPEETLEAENLEYSRKDQGRDALEEIVGIAVRLGMEQGRRCFINEHEFQTLQHQLLMVRMAIKCKCED